MAADGWFPQWFAGAWFPPVWFAPADEEHLTSEERAPEYHGGGKKQSARDLTPEEVRSQWELLELRTREHAPVHDATPSNDQNRIKKEDLAAASDSGEPPAVERGNYQGILNSSPTDAAGEPLAPDQAAAAIEARRQRNNKALAMLLMEL